MLELDTALAALARFSLAVSSSFLQETGAHGSGSLRNVLQKTNRKYVLKVTVDAPGQNDLL
jgi:hypothetical protein